MYLARFRCGTATPAPVAAAVPVVVPTSTEEADALVDVAADVDALVAVVVVAARAPLLPASDRFFRSTSPLRVQTLEANTW